ncbi:MAG TPA: glycosyltransferase family 9 protein [Candidatus Omnitrophota bacterium]|nr:glycosyltransferase family 9 protein [Candidatus Omnitrophota bacterium]MDD5270234.1 glycosyltransferase family 9 protein [Candidatus Omnitrophota bacterium]HOX09120.1 glycosyltransferase family 9 protein [Candidatus Omnitrophota bacterium]
MKPKNILLIRTDRIGEFILTTPAINAFRAGFPDAEITLAVSAASYEAAEGNPSVDRIIKLDPKKDLDSPFRMARFIASLREQRYGICAVFNPSKAVNVAVFLAGIPVRIGYDRKLGFLLNRPVADRKHLCEKHEVEYNLDIARAAGIDAKPSVPVFTVNAQDETGAARIARENGIREGERFIAVHPGTSNPEKIWPAERFGRLCAMIEKDLGAKVVLVGGQEEKPASIEVARHSGRPLYDLTGKLGLKEFGSLLRKAKALVSCDSGPVHISVAVGTPVVALFGESRKGGSSVRWGPYGRGHTVIGRPMVSDITVEEVFTAVKGING